MSALHKILAIVDEYKEAIGSGDYLKICDLLMNANKQPSQEELPRLLQQERARVVELTAVLSGWRHIRRDREREMLREIEELREENTALRIEIGKLRHTPDYIVKRLQKLNRIEQKIIELNDVKGIGAKTYVRLLQYFS